MSPFTIVVASDFEPASGHAFDLALQVALRIPRSHLDVVHVVGRSTDDGRLQRLSRLLGLYVEERFTADSYWGQSAGIHVRRGDKVRELARFASEVSADGILLGPRDPRQSQECKRPARSASVTAWRKSLRLTTDIKGRALTERGSEERRYDHMG